MRDTKDLLGAASRTAPPPGYTLDDLTERRRRRQRAHRIRALVAGLTLAAAVFGGAILALRTPSAHGPAGEGEVAPLPPATLAPLAAASGEYYYWRVHLLGWCEAGSCLPQTGVDYNELQATYWWAADGSGRIRVDEKHNYGIEGGTFGPGGFPNWNGVDVSSFPTDPGLLTDFLLERSAEDGSSPAPLVTPPPDGAPRDGQLWRAITDLLQDPHVTPAVRAALLEAAAGLQGSHVEVGGTDPVGRPAYVITFGNWGGEQPERLYVDPSTHELLAWSYASRPGAEAVYHQDFVVEAAGLVSSVDEGPMTSSLEEPRASLPRPPAALQPDVVEGCSQGGPDLELVLREGAFDPTCLVVETGAPFTITLRLEGEEVAGGLEILGPDGTEPVFAGERVEGPGSMTYRFPGLDGPGEYVFRDPLHPDTAVGILYVR